MRSFDVFMTNSGAADLEEIIDYVAEHDSPEKAEYVLSKIEKAFGSLSTAPERGSYPNELRNLGIRDFREIFFKPYRMIYRIVGKRVYVLVIIDGRRDIQTLLQRRLLEA